MLSANKRIVILAVVLAICLSFVLCVSAAPSSNVKDNLKADAKVLQFYTVKNKDYFVAKPVCALSGHNYWVGGHTAKAKVACGGPSQRIWCCGGVCSTQGPGYAA